MSDLLRWPSFVSLGEHPWWRSDATCHASFENRAYLARLRRFKDLRMIPEGVSVCDSARHFRRKGRSNPAAACLQVSAGHVWPRRQESCCYLVLCSESSSEGAPRSISCPKTHYKAGYSTSKIMKVPDSFCRPVSTTSTLVRHMVKHLGVLAVSWLLTTQAVGFQLAHVGSSLCGVHGGFGHRRGYTSKM